MLHFSDLLTNTSDANSKLDALHTQLELILADQVGEVTFIASIAALEASIAGLGVDLDASIAASSVAILGGIAAQTASIVGSINSLISVSNNIYARLGLIVSDTNNISANVSTLNGLLTDFGGNSVFKYPLIGTAPHNRSVFKCQEPTTGSTVSVFVSPSSVGGGDLSSLVDPVTKQYIGELNAALLSSSPLVLPTKRLRVLNLPG